MIRSVLFSIVILVVSGCGSEDQYAEPAVLNSDTIRLATY